MYSEHIHHRLNAAAAFPHFADGAFHLFKRVLLRLNVLYDLVTSARFEDKLAYVTCKRHGGLPFLNSGVI